MRSTWRWGLRAFLVIIIIRTGLLPGFACADEEGRMPLTHLQLDSKGLDNSGPVQLKQRNLGAG